MEDTIITARIKTRNLTSTQRIPTHFHPDEHLSIPAVGDSCTRESGAITAIPTCRKPIPRNSVKLPPRSLTVQESDACRLFTNHSKDCLKCISLEKNAEKPGIPRSADEDLSRKVFLRIGIAPTSELMGRVDNSSLRLEQNIAGIESRVPDMEWNTYRISEPPKLLASNSRMDYSSLNTSAIESKTIDGHQYYAPSDGTITTRSHSPSSDERRTGNINVSNPDDMTRSTKKLTRKVYVEINREYLKHGIGLAPHAEPKTKVSSSILAAEKNGLESISRRVESSSHSHEDTSAVQRTEDGSRTVTARMAALLVDCLISATAAEVSDTLEGSESRKRGWETCSTTSSQFSQRPPQKRVRGGGKDPRDDDDDSDDEEDPGKRPPSRKDISDLFGMPFRRLKCPFYQRQPERYSRAACRGPGFSDMAKLKDHIKRVHTQPPRCPRCWAEMQTDEECSAHFQAEAICEQRTEPIDNRIPNGMMKALDFKRLPYTKAKTAEEKWKMLYTVLFPNDQHIPSPYDQHWFTPKLKRALQEALEEELYKELSPALQPILQRIKDRIPAIVESCELKLYREEATPGIETTHVSELSSSDGNRPWSDHQYALPGRMTADFQPKFSSSENHDFSEGQGVTSNSHMSFPSTFEFPQPHHCVSLPDDLPERQIAPTSGTTYVDQNPVPYETGAWFGGVRFSTTEPIRPVENDVHAAAEYPLQPSYTSLPPEIGRVSRLRTSRSPHSPWEQKQPSISNPSGDLYDFDLDELFGGRSAGYYG